MLTAGGVLPPKIRREHYYGQEWSTNEGEVLNYGVIGALRFGAWTARLGAFESVFSPDAQFAELFTDIDANRNANEIVVAFPDSRYASRSGELRLSRLFEEGPRRHTLQFAARGRLQKRRYGGEDVIDVGSVHSAWDATSRGRMFVFGEQSHDEVKQQTFGAAYELQWADVGEMSVGLQKTSYSKSVETPTAVLPESRSEPWLKYATATVNATERLAIYASYTEGLEESPVAPNNALNRNVAAPALQTEQYDAGVRWAAFANMKLIAGVFNVEKPYFDVDAAGFFTELGTVEHRGVELSLAGDPLDNLTVILGTRWLDATVSGPTVDAGLIGEKPVGTARQYSLATADFRLGGTGASLDATVEHITSQVANSENTIEVPSRAVLHVGGRYRFKLFGRARHAAAAGPERHRQVRLDCPEQRRRTSTTPRAASPRTSPRICSCLNCLPCWPHQRSARKGQSRNGDRAGTSPCIALYGPLQSAPSVAGWSSLAARRAHNPKVVGSNPTPATTLSEREKGPVCRAFFA